jgi:hypothetical protein
VPVAYDQLLARKKEKEPVYESDFVQLPAGCGASLLMVPAIRPPLLSPAEAAQLTLLIGIVFPPETMSPPASAVSVTVPPSSIRTLAVTPTGFSAAGTLGFEVGLAFGKVIELLSMVSVAEQVLSAFTSVITMLVSAFSERGSDSDTRAIATMNKAARSAFLSEMFNRILFFALPGVIKTASPAGGFLPVRCDFR